MLFPMVQLACIVMELRILVLLDWISLVCIIFYITRYLFSFFAKLS